MEERVGEGGRKEEKEEDDFLAPPPNPFGDSKTSLEDVRSEPLVGDVDDEEEQGELLHMFLSSMEQLQMSPLRNRRGGENEDKAKKDKVEEGGKRRENIIQHPPSPVSEEHPIPSPTLPSPSPPPSPPSFSHYSSQKLNRRQPPVHQHQPASTKRQDRHNHNGLLCLLWLVVDVVLVFWGCWDVFFFVFFFFFIHSFGQKN